MIIRPMTVADAAQAEALTRLTPEASGWSAGDYAKLLTNETQSGLVGFGFVAEAASSADGEPELVGFILARAIGDEAEILNLAVIAAGRRQGTGSALLATAIQYIEVGKVHRVFLEVRESNQAARGFYRRHGFAEVGRRRGYYRQPDEDALVLEKKIARSG